ncbi:MAG: SUMF1/EgtB/PvdO family nonheme iron enzyme [Anaerolineae bacterium]|nr:SUMF1/EgtB/PvdO family nonheme iron enzyme [Anaerolineae bacterium]
MQIIKTLDVHDVWYDQRLHAGQKWWHEILKRLEWCDGLVYLISPDSVHSEYCQKEFEAASSAGKHIFPVIIQARTSIPSALHDYQHVDLSEGLTPETVKALLNAIYIAERTPKPAAPQSDDRTLVVRRRVDVRTSAANPESGVAEAAEALQNGEYDRAVFLLKHFKANGYASRFIDLNAMLQQAESALQDQSYLREARREYALIAALMQRERTRDLGFQAFEVFQRNFPNYDPDNLHKIYKLKQTLDLEWCNVSRGYTQLLHDDGQETVLVEPFRITKYPITNAQFQAFIDSPHGYADDRWWTYSSYVRAWHRENPEPLPVSAKPDLPRINVCWYEAVAFCLWLSAETHLKVMLPIESQWQYAAQGDDANVYPWGDRFDPQLCNSRESLIRHLSPVGQYPRGASPFGVVDMAGNAWEWCMNIQDNLSERHDFLSRAKRAIRGGSYISNRNRLQTDFHYHIDPRCRYDTIGFRVVCSL